MDVNCRMTTSATRRIDRREPPMPLTPGDDSDDSDLEEPPDLDEAHWDAFVPDDDERDPQPEPGDFWTQGSE
jgi:hypothetical protein